MEPAKKNGILQTSKPTKTQRNSGGSHKTFNPSEVLNEFSIILNINTNTYPSDKEVKERRPKLKTSAGETIREMRNESP